MSLASSALDTLNFAHPVTGADLLDIGQIVITTQVGLRCGTVRCGVARCGVGNAQSVLPADPFFNRAGVDSP